MTQVIASAHGDRAEAFDDVAEFLRRETDPLTWLDDAADYAWNEGLDRLVEGVGSLFRPTIIEMVCTMPEKDSRPHCSPPIVAVGGAIVVHLVHRQLQERKQTNPHDELFDPDNVDDLLSATDEFPPPASRLGNFARCTDRLFSVDADWRTPAFA